MEKVATEYSEGTTGDVLLKKLLLKISQYSQQNPSVFIKKRHQHKCFPVNIAEFLRAPILKNICERMLLDDGNSLF